MTASTRGRYEALQYAALKELVAGCRQAPAIPKSARAPMQQSAVATLVVAPVRDLMYQWQRRIQRGLGYDAGILADATHDVGPVTVATYDSAYIHGELGARFGVLHAEGSKTPVAAPEAFDSSVEAALTRSSAQRRAPFRKHHILVAVAVANVRQGAPIPDGFIIYKTALNLEPVSGALEQARLHHAA